MANFNENVNRCMGYITKNKCEQAVELINEAKRNIESCKNSLDTNECQLERAMDAIKLALNVGIASKKWRGVFSCGMKQKRRETESMWRAANKASESRDSTA